MRCHGSALLAMRPSLSLLWRDAVGSGDPLTRVLSAGEKLNVPSEIAPQRTRIHYGLAPHTDGWRGFYSGVIERSAAPVSVMSQPLGPGSDCFHSSLRARRGRFEAVSVAEADRDYSADAFPSAELRLLGAFRLWGAVHYFLRIRT